MFRYKRKKEVVTEEGQEYVDKQVKKIPKIITTIFFVYVVIFLAVMVWYFVFKSTHYISVVQGASMQPILNEDIGLSKYTSEDYVYVNTTKKGNHGDIVVIDVENSDPIIKRVIAKEGDKVSIFLSDDGLYYVNVIYKNTEEVIRLEEDYIKDRVEWRYSVTYSRTEKVGEYSYEGMFYDTFLTQSQNIQEVEGILFYEVPQGKCFCLGDNRAYSADSREKGAFEVSKIKGVAEIIVKKGVIDGDNRSLKKGISSILSYYWSNIEQLFAR